MNIFNWFWLERLDVSSEIKNKIKTEEYCYKQKISAKFVSCYECGKKSKMCYLHKNFIKKILWKFKSFTMRNWRTLIEKPVKIFNLSWKCENFVDKPFRKMLPQEDMFVTRRDLSKRDDFHYLFRHSVMRISTLNFPVFR